MGKHALVTVVCFSCAVAFATGDNTHPQGVRFAGLGFDEQQPLRKVQWVPRFENTHWPPKSRTYSSIGGLKQIKVEARCEEDPIPDPLFALCQGTVHDALGKPIVACDPKAGREPVPLLAIRGRWNTGTNAFEQDDQVLTFACAPTIKERPRWLHEIAPFTGDPSDTRHTNLEYSMDLGVLAKCYFWGFAGFEQPKKTEESRLATYQACLRAARAEYCGGGISQTEQGTVIQIYEPTETKVGQPTKVELDSAYCAHPKNPKSSENVRNRLPLKFKVCFEALWDNERALCVSHARFEEMPAEECKTKFPYEFSVEGIGKDMRVFPVPSGSPDPVFLNCQIKDYETAVQKARVKNRSGINKLDGSVKGCVNDIPCP